MMNTIYCCFIFFDGGVVQNVAGFADEGEHHIGASDFQGGAECYLPQKWVQAPLSRCQSPFLLFAFS
jgi:hypothetical protein